MKIANLLIVVCCLSAHIIGTLSRYNEDLGRRMNLFGQLAYCSKGALESLESDFFKQ